MTFVPFLPDGSCVAAPEGWIRLLGFAVAGEAAVSDGSATTAWIGSGRR
jgi:hypothetical protein